MRRRRGNRAGKKNFVPSIDVEAWLAKNPMSMVTCPNQPGNLKISAQSCVKRHKTANEPRFATIGAEPFNLFVFKMNLKPCADCELGARLAAKAAKSDMAAA